MTKVRFKGPIAGFSGEMDGMVFTDTKKKNRTTAYVKRNNPPSEAQLAVQARVAKAARRAKAKLEDPALREFYEMIARERDSLAHLVAVRDWMIQPTFGQLDLSEYKGSENSKRMVGNLKTFILKLRGMRVTTSNAARRDENPIQPGGYSLLLT